MLWRRVCYQFPSTNLPPPSSFAKPRIISNNNVTGILRPWNAIFDKKKKEKEEATFEFLRLCSSSVRSEEQMRFNKIERSWNKCGYLTLIENDRKNHEGTNFQVGFLIFRWKKIKFTLKLYIVYMRTWYERISFRFEFFKRFLINTWHNQRK